MDAYSCSIYDAVMSCRPPSILDVVPRAIFLELGRPGYEFIEQGCTFEIKYAVSKFLQPASILEIGVRFGYSLACMALASHRIRYAEGWDNCCYVKDSNATARANLRDNLGKPLEFSLFDQDSIKVKQLSRDFDLVHIDGSHNYENCLHDLELCLGRAKAILIDDVDKCFEDGRACQKFHSRHFNQISASVRFPTAQGDWLFLLK